MKKMSRKCLIFCLLLCLIINIFPGKVSKAKAKSPKLNTTLLNASLGSTFTLRVFNLKSKYKVSFSSNNQKYVSVSKISNKRAKISAIDIGSAKITATVKRGKKTIAKKKCTVNVSPSGISIKFMKKEYEMNVGGRINARPIIKPNTSKEQPVYSSDDTSVAVVSSRGVITGLSPGVATVRATLLSSDVSTTCTVVVLGSPYDELYNNPLTIISTPTKNTYD